MKTIVCYFQLSFCRFFWVFLYPINIALIKSRYYIVFPKYGPSFLMTSEFWGLGRLWGTSDRLSKTEHFVWKLSFNADILFIYFLFFPLYNLGPNWQGVLSATEVMMLLIATWPNRVMLFCAILLSEPDSDAFPFKVDESNAPKASYIIVWQLIRGNSYLMYRLVPFFC